MDVLHNILLVLISLWGSLAQEDLEKQVLIFPAASNTAHVVLNATLQEPLTSFTVCLRSYTDLTRAYSLFSYATKTVDNELLLFSPKPNQFSLYVGGATVTFSVPGTQTPTPGGDRICTSWESATGLAEFWWNGQPLPRKGLKEGYSISAQASIVLGQEQDSFGGGFDIKQSFLGELSNVCMWDRVLTRDEINLVWRNGILSGYLINWRSLRFQTQGYVVIKPALYPVHV